MISKEILHSCVDEMYHLESGVFIDRPDEIILECGDGYMTRRQIKHIIENRAADGQSIEEIKRILDRVPDVMTREDFEISNENSRYPGSILRIKVFKGWRRGIVVVMDKLETNKRAIITAYPYHAISAYFLLLKKLHASAAGEAPYPKVIPEG